MQFGLFGSAQARRGGPDVDSAAGFRDFVEYNVEAEALGFHSSFIVEHHFTGFGQVSASLNRPLPSICCRGAGLISASVRATGIMNSPGSVSPWRRQSHASTKS